MSSLDVQIIHEDKTYITSVYNKPTFCGVYTLSDSFLTSTCKFGTVNRDLVIDASDHAQFELNYALDLFKTNFLKKWLR